MKQKKGCENPKYARRQFLWDMGKSRSEPERKANRKTIETITKENEIRMSGAIAPDKKYKMTQEFEIRN